MMKILQAQTFQRSVTRKFFFPNFSSTSIYLLEQLLMRQTSVIGCNKIKSLHNFDNTCYGWANCRISIAVFKNVTSYFIPLMRNKPTSL